MKYSFKSFTCHTFTFTCHTLARRHFAAWRSKRNWYVIEQDAPGGVRRYHVPMHFRSLPLNFLTFFSLYMWRHNYVTNVYAHAPLTDCIAGQFICSGKITYAKKNITGSLVDRCIKKQVFNLLWYIMVIFPSENGQPSLCDCAYKRPRATYLKE